MFSEIAKQQQIYDRMLEMYVRNEDTLKEIYLKQNRYQN